jgi:hypothetical protein
MVASLQFGNPRYITFCADGLDHRVDRVLGFFSSRPNWNPPLPHPQASVFPPLWFRGEGTDSLAGEVVGGYQFRGGGQTKEIDTIE